MSQCEKMKVLLLQQLKELAGGMGAIDPTPHKQDKLCEREKLIEGACEAVAQNKWHLPYISVFN